MSPHLPVKSLYKTCLLVVFNQLHSIVKKNSDSVESLREFVVSSFHRGIRQHLIDIATRCCCTSDVYILLDLLGVLLDKSIKRLDPTGGDEEALLRSDQCARLFECLDRYDGTGIQDLVVKVRLTHSHRGGLETISPGNLALHRALRQGLAASLHTLILHSVCDNETLRLLGNHASNLTHLDVSSSWLVDDNGLRQLLLQDPELYSLKPEGFDGNEALLRSMCTLAQNRESRHRLVNACCLSLQEVRIQDTNTSEVVVAMLLLFVPNLRSLGGFIYYRSVGEAIITLLQQSHDNLRLALTELWDTHMPPVKASVLCRTLPKLSSLYTRATWLPTLSIFTELSCLTIDFDFIDFSNSLERFLKVVPQALQKLVLVDQMHAVDLAMLGELCPGLEDLSAKVEGTWGKGSKQTGVALLPALHTCRVRIYSQDTFRSLFVHSSKLRLFEVILETRPFTHDDHNNLDDSLISSALLERTTPPELVSLNVSVSNTWCNLSAVSVRLLAQNCPNLKYLGDLNLWRVNERKLGELTKEIVNKNWDLQLVCRGEIFPAVDWRRLEGI